MASRPTTKVEAGARPDWTNETDLALKRFGARIAFATDDWFAVAEHLLSHEPPVFIPDQYTEFGKWMDGWESRRKRTVGHDWCIIKLAFAGRILGVDVDTSFFTGNHSPRCSIQAATLDDEPATLRELAANRRDPDHDLGKLGTKPTDEEMQIAETVGSAKWHTVVDFTPLQPGYVDSCHHFFEVKDDTRYTHLRLNMFPDGGIARLRVYGEVAPNWGRISEHHMFDLAAVEHGGTAVGCSDMHFGHPKNLIYPGRGINMGDGWETARKLNRPPIFEADENGLIKLPGNDWAILKLGCPGVIERLEIDTGHFKGNYPESCLIEGALLPAGTNSKAVLKMQANDRIDWRALLARVQLGPDTQVWFDTSKGLQQFGPVTHLRLTIYPDGGVSRIRAFGRRHGGANL